MAIKGRDTSQGAGDRNEQVYKQYEGDVFLKHGDDPDSTAISIKENQISVHTEEGNVGILVRDNGNIYIQGKPIIKVSGKSISKGDYTENDDSWKQNTGMGGSIGGSTGIAVPHIHLHRHSIPPTYLYRWPSVQLVSGMKNLLQQFQKLFQ